MMWNLWQVVQNSWTRKCPPGRCHSEALLRKIFDPAIGSPCLSTITNLHTQLWWEQGSWQSCIPLGALVQPVHRSLEHLSKAQTWIPCPHRVNLQLSKHIVMILLHYEKQLFPARSHSIFFSVLLGTQKDQSNVFKQRKFGKKSNLINLERLQRSTVTYPIQDRRM